MTDYKNYEDFVKSRLLAVPVGIAQPQMRLGTVLVHQKKWRLGRDDGFVRVGDLTSLSAFTEGQKQVLSDLAKEGTLKHPFGTKTEIKKYTAAWKPKFSGLLGALVPNTAEVKTWINSNSKLKFEIHDVTVHFLKDAYLVDIIHNGKWKPNVDSLKDFYIINELVLTTKINIGLSNEGSAGARLALPVTVAPVGAELSYSQSKDGSLDICSVTEGGHQKPFAIAFRTAHIQYKDDFTGLRKPLKLGVLRGEDDARDDGHHLSAFVRDNQKHHIGEFFLGVDEDEKEEPKVVAIDFDCEAGTSGGE